MKSLPESLRAWEKYPQFVLCKIIDGRKTPVSVSGYPVDPHLPENQMECSRALELADTLGLLVGFVFTRNDPFWFLDIDHCIDMQTGQLNDIAAQLLEVFKGAAVETSTSGEGLHIFGCGEVGDHGKKNKQYGIEFYTEGRFVLLTGEGASGNVWLDWSSHAQWLVQTYFQPSTDISGSDAQTSGGPVDGYSGPSDDDELVRRMLNAKGGAASIFGGKASIKDLWECNVDVLSRVYPTQNDSDPFDRSQADAALASHLAFWTGKDQERITRLMWMSQLVREKWTGHPSYMEMTVNNAVAVCKNVYQDPREKKLDIVTSDGLEPTFTVGVQFMSCQQQVEYFKGCIYLRRNHCVMTSKGLMLKPEQFKAEYAGYTFALDGQNDKTTTNAWDAFIGNQAVRFPRADGVCFRPAMAPLQMVLEDGFTLVNNYVPISVASRKGDITMFHNHMKRLFPDKGDRDIIYAYMAAIVQHKGVKFQWCPIIQGTEGNGKTLLARVVEQAVGRRYTHYPNASELSSGGLKFNGWIEGKIFIAIEEVHVSDRRDATEPLKILITNDRMEIQHKGLAQYTGDNLANIMMFSNHKDCMKLTKDQRRYFVVYTGQQSSDDLRDQGMNNDYFKRIYDWLKNGDGYAMVTEFLSNYQIPEEYNPAGVCQRAPRSSSTEESIVQSYGRLEQHILEAIDEQRPGFRGGYISTYALDCLLKDIRMDLSPFKRKEALEALGYVKHPLLRDGRVSSAVSAEGCKPRLFYRDGADINLIWNQHDVKVDYELKQGYAVSPTTP